MMQCGNKNYVTFRKKNAGRLQPGIRRFDKLMFVEQMCSVTFLYPNKKVTKEIVRGEALRANRKIVERLPPASDLFGFAARSTTRPGPHSRRNDYRLMKMFRFSVGSAEQTCWLAK